MRVTRQSATSGSGEGDAKNRRLRSRAWTAFRRRPLRTIMLVVLLLAASVFFYYFYVDTLYAKLSYSVTATSSDPTDHHELIVSAMVHYRTGELVQANRDVRVVEGTGSSEVIESKWGPGIRLSFQGTARFEVRGVYGGSEVGGPDLSLKNETGPGYYAGSDAVFLVDYEGPNSSHIQVKMTMKSTTGNWLASAGERWADFEGRLDPPRPTNWFLVPGTYGVIFVD